MAYHGEGGVIFCTHAVRQCSGVFAHPCSSWFGFWYLTVRQVLLLRVSAFYGRLGCPDP